MSAHDGSAGGPHPYDRQYYETALGPIPYDRRHPEWLAFFGGIADRIARDIKPGRVLDVGCAKGFLVEALRDRGVEAFGIDISEYALGEVRPDIRPYCRLASATEPFESRYDLIVCLEVVEHVGEDDGDRMIANICRSADDVLFSSTPDDVSEPTHVNVRPRSWWIERFARHGLTLDAAFDAGFVAVHAMRFTRGGGEATAVDRLLAHRDALLSRAAAREREVETRERADAELRAELAAAVARRARLESDLAAVQRGAEAVRNALAALRQETEAQRLQMEARRLDLDAREAELHSTRSQAAGRREEVDRLQQELSLLEEAGRDKDKLIAGLNYHLLAVQQTLGWKILQSLRPLRDRLLPTGSRRRDMYWRVRRPTEVFLDEGPRAFFWKTRHKLRLKWRGQEALVKTTAPSAPGQDPDALYQAWIERHRPSPQDVLDMKAAIRGFAYRPVVSVVTPVYDPDESWLRQAIESVRAQLYPDWELCLADDGSTRPHVRAVLDEYAAADTRVRVEYLGRNQGIARASTRGLRMATGEFVALLDHDDELPPEALFEVVRRLNAEPDLDLVYTDEDKLDPTGRRVEPFFKPDWNPDLLLSMNYITHLSVFRRALLQDIGGFRPGTDGSQDYDLLLRASERTSRIAHIPKILYHWRKVPGSAAASVAAKPFAYEAGRRAIEEALARRGREARVASVQPGVYAARYALAGTPLVSIVIPTRDRWPLLEQCLRSIEEKTRHPRYEIIVLDNDSAEPETRRSLDAVAPRWRVYSRPGAFNFSALSNFGAARAFGEYLVFLNNDTQVIDGDWLTAMLEHAQRPEVGAVGARLHYPDERIQHAGMVLGVGGVADHAFKGQPGAAHTYFGLGSVVRDVSAVTAACMMMSRRVFDEIGGFDERLAVALNDVDLCLRLRARGYLIVYTPFSLLYHHESSTRGRLHPPEDEELVWARWGDVIRKGDPYYNPNLTLSRTDWSLGD